MLNKDQGWTYCKIKGHDCSISNPVGFLHEGLFKGY